MLIRTVFAWLAAVVVTTVLGITASTQFVIAGLESIGLAVPMADRLSMTAADIAGMAPLYGAIIAVGLAIAFVIAGYVAMLAPSLRWFVYVVAGASALLAVLVLVETLLGQQGVAGARLNEFGIWGYAAQKAAGAAGGLVYALVRPATR